MKLISCYIENYGCIKQKEFNFSEDLTSICANNGYGKTTFASFLKAMFYGLEGYKSNTKEFCDRLHYFPFDGSQFGGNLTFEMNGKTYKIQRFFKEKTGTNDECIVYCNGTPTSEFFNNEVGKCIFGIDSKSFERTIFVDNGEIEIASTASINSKLNIFLDGGDEVDYERSIMLLDSSIKDYKKGSGLIAQTKTKIEELNYLITNAENVKNALNDKYETYKKEKERGDKLKEQYHSARNRNLVLKDWEIYNNIMHDIKDSKQKIDNIMQNYPFGLPDSDEVDRVALKIEKVGELKAKKSQCNFDDSDEGKLAKLNAKFSSGIPEKQELETIEQTISQCSSLDGEINAMGQTDSPSNSPFAKGYPNDMQIQSAKNAAIKYKEFTAKAQQTPPQPTQQEKQAPTKKLNTKLLFIPAVVLLLLGVGLIFVNAIIGGSIAAIGAVCCVICVLLMFMHKKVESAKSVVPSIPAASGEEKKQQKGEELLACIQALIQPYGYKCENGVIDDFANFERDLLVFKEIESRETEKQNKRKQKIKEKQELEKNLTDFFAQYGYTASFLSNLSELKKDLNSYSDLKSHKQKANENLENLSNQIAEHVNYVKSFCEKYHFNIESIREKINSISNDLRVLEDLNTRVEKGTAKSENFKKEKNLTTPPEMITVDLYTLNRDLEEVENSCSRLQLIIDREESIVENLDSLIADRNEALEKMQEYKKTLELLTATRDSIIKAEQNLQDRYINPIKDKFIDYSAMLEKTLGEKVSMTKDFQISFERLGKQRSEKYLSMGQRAICALCFRLALIYNMYEHEKPFIILDDAFVALDSEHFEKVKNLLKTLSQKMQIIYLTCHESRTI